MNGIKVIDFELSPYRDIWTRQQSIRDKIIEDKRAGITIYDEFILIGEHLPVYTLGFHGKENNLLVDEDTLKKRGIECIRIERGGDITFHGPGQLIVYPILD
ncbi:MAG: lipoate--protein ligase, partial [Muribaculaceae bacterium]|nr:lipoate--protein ligase [Muribaculaceae bacterium]